MSTSFVRSLVTNVRRYSFTHGRFALMRRLLWAFLVVDVVVTVTYILAFSGPSRNVRVWYEVGVPANILMINTFSNEDLENVEITLDNKFKFEQNTLPPKTSGFPMDSHFRAGDGSRPPDNYKPQQVVIEIDGEQTELDLR